MASRKCVISLARTGVLRTVILSLAALAVAARGVAQTSEGYVFGGAGQIHCCGHAVASLAQVGGGGERFLTPRVAIGVEGGILGSSGVELVSLYASVNGLYFFRRARHIGEVEPFVTGGYTQFLGDGPLLNAGAGINYWIAPQWALRVELRNHTWPR